MIRLRNLVVKWLNNPKLMEFFNVAVTCVFVNRYGYCSSRSTEVAYRPVPCLTSGGERNLIPSQKFALKVMQKVGILGVHNALKSIS